MLTHESTVASFLKYLAQCRQRLRLNLDYLYASYTLFDESGTVRVGRYQDPRASMGHLISNSKPDGTPSAFRFSLFLFKTQFFLDGSWLLLHMFGQVRTASLPGQLIQWMHTSLIFAVKYGATLETVYKVAICHRFTLQKTYSHSKMVYWASKCLLYKWFYLINSF